MASALSLAQDTGSGDPIADWEDLASGPALAFHCGGVLGNTFYVHGGVTKRDNTQPSNKLYSFSIATKTWQELPFPGSPCLSHHACVPFENRFLVFIGGWNGKIRTADVIVFDTEKNIWLPQTVSGFPEGGGLSSHTTTLLDQGNILVLGREGSLRMQRRHGSGYLLKGHPATGKFHYSEFTQATASRSGHVSLVVGNSLYILGGRDNNFVEKHAGFENGHALNEPALFVSFSKRTGALKLSKIPSGRKHHVAIGGKNIIFIYGGETFDGRCRYPVGEMFLLTLKPKINFYKLGVSHCGRAGAVCVVIGDQIILHGGLDHKNSVSGDTFVLKELE